MSGALLAFFVPGVPVPQGSVRAYERAGKTFTKAANAGRLERWRGDIRNAISAQGRFLGGPIDQPFEVGATFVFARPKSHLNARGEVRPAFANRRPRGDIDKLLRAVLDALTHVVWIDDEQVVLVTASRRWAVPGERAGAHITIGTEDSL